MIRDMVSSKGGTCGGMGTFNTLNKSIFVSIGTDDMDIRDDDLVIHLGNVFSVNSRDGFGREHSL